MTAPVLDLDAYRPIWEVAMVRCLACGDEHVGVCVSLDARPDASRWLECGRCRRMAAARVEILA